MSELALNCSVRQSFLCMHHVRAFNCGCEDREGVADLQNLRLKGDVEVVE